MLLDTPYPFRKHHLVSRPAVPVEETLHCDTREGFRTYINTHVGVDLDQCSRVARPVESGVGRKAEAARLPAPHPFICLAVARTGELDKIGGAVPDVFVRRAAIDGRVQSGSAAEGDNEIRFAIGDRVRYNPEPAVADGSLGTPTPTGQVGVLPLVANL